MSGRGEGPGGLGTRTRKKPALQKAAGGGIKVTKLVRAPQESAKVMIYRQLGWNARILTW